MRSNNKRQYSEISRRILNRFFISMLILFAIMVGGYYVAWFVCSRIAWGGDTLLYNILKALQALSPVIILAIMAAGCIIFLVIAIKKPLQYLDEVIDAAKTLSDPDAPTVSLPQELSEVENELNLARAQSRENLRLRRDAEQRKNDLIMYLAHDLKTPLSSVIGYLTLLHDEGEISPELREKYLSIALDKAERLEDLINEFFEITRFNLSEITLQYGRIDLTRLLEQLVFEFKPMLSEKNLTCDLQAPKDMMLRCDGDKLQRVFDNLLRNAVLYSYPDTNITITAAREGSRVTIRFRNRGDTIPEEKLSRIFEQFYRLDAARSSGGGAGLGLAIAEQIVELHGGTITAQSAEELIEFTVILPLS